MARLGSYLAHPLAEAAGWALLHSLWQGALVALLFAGGLMLVRNRSPQLRYLLGCAALMLLTTLPVVTGALLYDPGIRPMPGLEPQAHVELGGSAPAAPTQANSAASSAPAPPALESLVEGVTDGLETSSPWLAGLWLVGVSLLLLRLCGQALYVHRFRLRHQTPANVAWQARAQSIATQLGVRHVWRLVQSDKVESPLTVGVLRSLIVLPTSALTGIPAAQLEALLAHELAHIKRHDYLVNLVQCVVETLLFYHPAAWWVSGEVRRAREECCDDLAVSLCGDAKLYARALTNLEGLRQRQPALTLAATNKPLLVRVQRLLGLKEALPFLPSTTAVLLLLVLALGTGLGLGGQPALAQRTPVAPRTTPTAPERGSTLRGIVVWDDERLANINVELREDVAGLTPWMEQPLLMTTTTNAQGEYVFKNVPPGDYFVWVLGDAAGYQTAGYPAVAYAQTSGYDVLRLDKPIEVIGPTLTTSVSLTPTLRWKPFPGAARYEVGLDDLSAVEDPLPPRRYWRTEVPRLKVEQPLERDKVYGWSVNAYTEDGTRIAVTYDPVFSTSLNRTRLPAHIESIGVRTVLFEGWRQVSPRVFEYTNAEGEQLSLTFERVHGTDPTTAFDSAITRMSPPAPQRYGGREWQSFGLEDGSAKLATVQGDSVYLITVEGEYEPTPLIAEFYSFVLPFVMQNFKIDEQL